ncbi:MAG TPA: putative Ig domain-containing protein, partial [Sporichthya sp.]|nr:putative Ig domain-containing protein [Sporichthya sp.]
TNTAEIIGCNPNSDVDSVFGNGDPTEDDQQSVTISSLLTITTPAGPLLGATAGAPYYQLVAATGGVPTYTWSLTSAAGTFPFDLDPATGVISGTAPLAAGNYTFTLMVSDSSGPPATASQTFSILVVAAPGGTPTVNTTPPPPAGTVGVAYSHTFTATGGTPPYLWTSTGAALPGGLLLNPSTGELSGTPTAAATFGGLMIDANGASAPFSITINPNPITTLPLTLPNGSVGSIYDQPIQAVGGLGSTFTWTVSSGTRPPGLNPVGSGRVAQFTGTPTTNGTFTFTLKAQDAGGVFGTKAYTVTILPGSAPFAPTAPSAPPAGTANRPFFLNLTGVGGTRPYTWSLAAGSLPAGLTLNGPAGNISGTPTAAGVFQITLSAHDVASASGSQTMTITIAPAPVITTASQLPDATDGVAYFAQFSVAGGAAPYTWSAVGLPIGTLDLSPSSGALCGVPTPAGPASFDVTVTDVNGASATLSGVSLSILATGPALGVLSGLPPASVGVPYSATVVASGGTGPYTYAMAPGATLPSGWTLDTNGTIFGTPPATPVIVQVRVTDSVLTFVDTNLLVVASPLAVAQNTLPSGIAGSGYATALTTTGGLGLTRVWTLVSGSLPPGLSMSPAGLISGVPQANGSSIFRVQVSDTQGGVAQRQFSISIGASLPPGGGGKGGGGGGGCGLLGAEVLLLWLWRRERRRKA